MSLYTDIIEYITSTEEENVLYLNNNEYPEKEFLKTFKELLRDMEKEGNFYPGGDIESEFCNPEYAYIGDVRDCAAEYLHIGMEDKALILLEESSRRLAYLTKDRQMNKFYCSIQ